MKLGFNAIIKAVTKGGYKTALIAAGTIAALAIVAKVVKNDDDDCEDAGLDAEVIDIEAEYVDDLKED